MRIVLSTYGSRGDVEPLVALALELQRIGAEVRLCAPPDFAQLLGSAGVALTPVGWPIRALATGTIPGAPTSLAGVAVELTAASYRAVLEVAERADVVVATGSLPSVAGAQSAAEQLGIRFVSATFSPPYLPSPHQAPMGWPGMVRPEGETDNRVLWRLHAEHLDTMMGEPINAHRASVGLPPMPSVWSRTLADRPLLAADPVLGPWQPTDDLDVVQTGAWLRAGERPLPPDLVAFLEAGDPPVFVGFGSMPLRGADDVDRAVIGAVRAQGRRALLGRGWAELSAIDDRDDCFVIGEVDQLVLFRRVAAAVHHGGAGTTTTAALAGAPQVIVPQVADQPYWAARVAALGIGVAHDGPTPTLESLSAALAEVLSPETRARATTVAADIRTDGATVAARLLLTDPRASGRSDGGRA